jgi:hypothetical protein
VGEIADEWIKGAQPELRSRMAAEIAAQELVSGDTDLEGCTRSVLSNDRAVLAREAEHALDASDPDLALAPVDLIAELADRLTGAVTAEKELIGCRRPVLGPILFLGAVPASALAHVLTQQRAGPGIEDANVELIPLHDEICADVSRRHGVVGALDLDVAVEVHDALAEVVVAERLDGQWQQMGTLLSNMAATWRLVVPWMRVSAQWLSQ